MMPLLALRGLRKQFGGRALLDIEAFDIGPASAYVLTGINGAGKSTLLRILAGLEPAHCDHFSFMGQAMPLTPYPAVLRTAIVYVHQHPAMFATSVADNIGYGLRARGVSPDERRRLVDEAMAWAGVSQLRERRTQTLSGGEKQRIALARARILAPKLLLLDEPSANLDGAAREQVIALIPSLIEQGSSVVMACHDRDLIALPAVQRLKLMEGRLEAR